MDRFLVEITFKNQSAISLTHIEPVRLVGEELHFQKADGDIHRVQLSEIATMAAYTFDDAESILPPRFREAAANEH